jgi:hypothetical protein
MSAEHVEAAFEAMQGADLTPAAKLLLVAYALHLSPEGTPTKSWRGLGKICGLSMDATFRSKALIDSTGALKYGALRNTEHPALKYGAPCSEIRSTERSAERSTLARVLINNKEINNTHTTCACACEDKPSAVAAFCRAYPKRTFLNATVQAAWDDCIAEGITAEEIMRCLELAKMSKAWEEQQGRFIPKAAVWLHERRFSADLKSVRAELCLKAKQRKYARVDDDIEALVNGVDE